MRLSPEFSSRNSSRFRPRPWTLVLPVVALSLVDPAILLADDSASAATSQISRDTTNDQVSPPNVLTGPDFRMLMKIMRTNIVSCGGPLTAVLHWHVLPDGVIDNFVLNKSSGNVCFDEIVILNAEEVVKAKLRITPATRNGILVPAWVPFSVAARD
jgi:hypothetical protein